MCVLPPLSSYFGVFMILIPSCVALLNMNPLSVYVYVLYPSSILPSAPHKSHCESGNRKGQNHGGNEYGCMFAWVVVVVVVVAVVVCSIGQYLPLRALPDSIETSPCGARAVLKHHQIREQQHTLKTGRSKTIETRWKTRSDVWQRRPSKI